MAGPPRVLILSAAMGAGHLQVARELSRRLTERGGSATIADLLELMPLPAGRGLRWVYPTMVNHAPRLYDVVYDHFFLVEQHRAERASLPVRWSLPGLRALVGDHRPDLVVSTYHLAGVAAAELRARGSLPCPAVTMITTFGVHDLWLHPATDGYLCITPAAAARVATRTSVPIEVCEPVVRPGFARQGPPDRAARAALAPGADHVALVVAGSLGLGGVAGTAAAIAALPGWRPVVVCGANERLRRQVAGVDGAVALGWVDDMAGILAAADVVVDNAAGSTAKEALSLGRPVVTYRPLPGHGRHDALMMGEVGLTDVEDDPRALRGTLERLSAPEVARQRVERGWALFGVDPAERLEAFRAALNRERAA